MPRLWRGEAGSSVRDARASAGSGREGGGIPLATLLTSAHNHAFGFGILALLFGLGCTFTGLPAWLRVALPSLAFLGAALDLAGWFLTRSHGAPFPALVILGGALFGAALGLMALAILVEVARPRGAAV